MLSPGGSGLLLCEHFGKFHLLIAKGSVKGLEDGGIKVFARSLQQDIAGLIRRHSFAVRPVTDQRIINIGNGDDSRFQGDVFAVRRVVARPVKLVVVRKDDR